MFIIPKYLSFLFRWALHKDGKGIQTRSPIVQPFWFAACGLLGAVAGWTLLILGPLGLIGSIFVFLLSGFFAGLGLRSGIAPALGVGVVFAVGDLGWVLSLMSLQGMGDYPSMREMVMAYALMYALMIIFSYGIGSIIGLLPFLKFGIRVWVAGFLGFIVGGLLGVMAYAMFFLACGGDLVGNRIIFSLMGLMFACAGGGMTLAKSLNSLESWSTRSKMGNGRAS
jgi:hypothetical protein